MSTTLPLKWHGGKHYLADWILEHRPAEYITYCEPYFGGGSVLFHHDPEGHSEIVNDINDHLMNFWRVLADPALFAQLHRLLSMTPVSQRIFEACKEAYEKMGPDVEYVYYMDDGGPQIDPHVVNAAQFFCVYRMSRQGLGKNFATMSKTRTRRGMNEQVSSWLGAIEGLPEAHQRITRVAIFNDDALKIIKSLDDENTWFYLDPPYPHDTRSVIVAYDYEMTRQAHLDLLEVLATLKGKFTLSSYPSDLYNGVANDLGWRCVQKEVPLHSSSKASKDTKTECLWMNYDG